MAKISTIDVSTGEVIERDMTEAEVAESWPPNTPDDIRSQRDFILATSVDPLVSNPLRWADLTAEQQQAWKDYRHALLNVPQQSGFPQDVIWPVQPS